MGLSKLERFVSINITTEQMNCLSVAMAELEQMRQVVTAGRAAIEDKRILAEQPLSGSEITFGLMMTDLCGHLGLLQKFFQAMQRIGYVDVIAHLERSESGDYKYITGYHFRFSGYQSDYENIIDRPWCLSLFDSLFASENATGDRVKADKSSDFPFLMQNGRKVRFKYLPTLIRRQRDLVTGEIIDYQI
ncbi:MAG: hypothetical protein M1607_04450 [Patescibacteria group bacterium]|nr:hypothetical protein [Patescibacteria group bacterium]